MRPILTINLEKLKENTKLITGMVRRVGGVPFAVVKVVGGLPEIGQALLVAGAEGLADSRLDNIIKLRQGGITASIILLRSPALSQIQQVISFTDVSLNSEKQVLAALSHEAGAQQRKHGVILMVDLGDGREGVPPNDLVDLVRFTERLPHIYVYGIGTNFTCFSGEIPTPEHMRKLVHLKESFNNNIRFLSAGTSSGLYLLGSPLETNPWLRKINHWRIGESLFLGANITTKEPLPGCYQDACLLNAEVIEVQTKALTGFPKSRRIVVALGLQELGAGKVKPLDPKLKIVGLSSDHLVLVSDAQEGHTIKVGDILTFSLDYQSLLAVATSPYVAIKYSDCL